MTRRMIEPQFDPALPVVVRKPFVSNGRRLRAGQRWNWQQQAVAQRRVRQLYDARYIIHEHSPRAADLVGVEEKAEPVADTAEAQIGESIQLNDDDFATWGYRALQAECKSRNINAKGSRDELIDRLRG